MSSERLWFKRRFLNAFLARGSIRSNFSLFTEARLSKRKYLSFPIFQRVLFRLILNGGLCRPLSAR